MKKFDAIICGGGMVGAATALGLAQQGYEVLVIERGALSNFQIKDPVDLRISALSQGSVALLTQLGVWDRIAAQRVCPFRRLSAWEQSEQDRLSFSAEEINQPQLGFMVENRLVQWALWEALEDHDNVVLRSQCQILRFIPDLEKGYEVVLASGESVFGDCLVGADGGNSQVRQAMHIGSTAWQYRQSCLLIHVKSTAAQSEETWQKFRPEGAIAWLPLPNQEASLVWYDTPEKIEFLNELSFSALKNEIEATFPKCIGEIQVRAKGGFPLTRHHAPRYFARDAVLLGDAAHTIHPMAGQGVNLGFRDVEAFLSLTKTQRNWDQTVLAQYERHRRRDNLLMQTGMDVLYHTFKSSQKPVMFGRHWLLKMANRGGLMKRKALSYALGLENIR